MDFLFCVYYAFKWPLLKFHRSITKTDIHKTGYFLNKYPREKRSTNLDCELRICHEFWLAKQSFLHFRLDRKKILQRKVTAIIWVIHVENEDFFKKMSVSYGVISPYCQQLISFPNMHNSKTFLIHTKLWTKQLLNFNRWCLFLISYVIIEPWNMWNLAVSW